MSRAAGSRAASGVWQLDAARVAWEGELRTLALAASPRLTAANPPTILPDHCT